MGDRLGMGEVKCAGLRRGIDVRRESDMRDRIIWFFMWKTSG